jgi:DNA-binding IscR family transcriptional regulator
MSAVNGHEELAMSAAATSPAAAVLRDIWQQLARAQRKILDSTTLADLVHRARQYGEPMYYI